jgi:hypothetical protein
MCVHQAAVCGVSCLRGSAGSHFRLVARGHLSVCVLSPVCVNVTRGRGLLVVHSCLVVMPGLGLIHPVFFDRAS